MCLRVPLLGVDEVGELGWVTNEEDRCVIKHPVPISLLGPQLDRKPTRIASSVGGSRLASNSREANCSSGLGANLLEEGCRGDVAQLVSDLEVTVGTSTLGVDLEHNRYEPEFI